MAYLDKYLLTHIMAYHKLSLKLMMYEEVQTEKHYQKQSFHEILPVWIFPVNDTANNLHCLADDRTVLLT